MIVATVKQGDTTLMTRDYSDATLSLEEVMKKLEFYVTQEQINTTGEVVLNARFAK